MMQVGVSPPGDDVLVYPSVKPFTHSCPIDIYINKQGTTHDNFTGINIGLAFMLDVVANNANAPALIDTGGTCCAVSQDFVHKVCLNIKQTTHAEDVEVVNGKKVCHAGTCRVHLLLQGRKPFTAEVFPSFILDNDIL
jgi:hypothetical protein